MTSKLKKLSSNDKLKQKSLTSFFAKSSAASLSSGGSGKKRALNSSSDPPDYPSSSPNEKASNSRVGDSVAVKNATFSKSSDGGSSFKDTPPTSDPIDVDMLSDDEFESRPKTTRIKRKIVAEDSDSDDNTRSAGGKYSTSMSGTKKPRLSEPLSEEGGNSDDNDARRSFTQKLSRFKQKPVKSQTSYRRAPRKDDDDDDDFIVPDDAEESDIPSISSKARQRSSSRSSMQSGTSALSGLDSEDEDIPKAKKKVAPKKATRGKGDSLSFLTAAEERLEDKKADKKADEKSFEFLKDVKDKDGVRPGEPGYDPRTIYIPPKSWQSFSPFEKQFWEIKQNHYDTVLFFQKGKFLELYEEDAVIGHRDFDLKLTQRVKMSMVGVPEYAFNFWAAKFLGRGYKVGRVDQAETALGAEMRVAADKSQGKKSGNKDGEKIVRRELHKVYTNGTLVDEELLTDEQAGHCVSIREDAAEEGTFGVCVLDSATSEFNLSAFQDDICRTRLETLMRQLRPKEVVFTKGNLSVSTMRLLKTVLPFNCLWTTLRDVEGFDYGKTLEELKTLYPVSDGEDDMDDEVLPSTVPKAIREMLGSRTAVEALGALIWYLRQLNIDKDILSMKNFNIYDPMKKGQGLTLDGQTLAHIEVLMNSDGAEDGTLLKLLGRCMTPSGKRLFRIWLCMPLCEVSDINARLDAIQDLIDHPTFESDFCEIVKGLPDLERIVSRVHAKNCRVKDFIKVLSAFRKLNKGLASLANISESFKSKNILGLLRSAPDLAPHIRHVESMYEKPEKESDELVPVDGKDEVYDGVMEEIVELEQGLEDELTKLEKKLGCKLSYWHSAQGTKDIYLVQTKPKQEDIPKDWIKSGSTKAAIRWKVPALMSTIRTLKEARENRNQAIKTFKNRLYAEFDSDRSVWLRAVRVLSELDCLFSLAKSSIALGEPMCRPEFVEGDSAFVEFEDLRHPALCTSERLKGDFIPNNVKLGEGGRIALLTGPNMGGKSTVMRMTGAGIIMAQLGMFVPASKARLCPVDCILTRMGAYDNMFSNASTFKVELDECCKILRDATPKSFVILDELGRGTSTYDGMAIAGAVLHELSTHTLALSFFATHYGSLTDDFAYHPNIRNMHMETLVDDEKHELVFLYKLVEGIASSSFGTHVASLAGVPKEVVDRADSVSKDFARQFKEKIEGKKKQTRLPLVAQADFAYLYGLATGKYSLPDNAVRKKEVLRGLKQAVKMCLAGTTTPK